MENFSLGRGDRIRTCDHLVPNQARYRTALHPVNQSFLICECKGTNIFLNSQMKRQLFYDILFYKYLFQCLNTSLNLFFGVSGH